MRVVRWTTTGRSTICTAERPESAARCCSHARCRHVSEHHLGVLPRAFTGMVVPHHGQVMVSGRCRCSRTLAPDEPASESCEAPAFRSVTVASPTRYGIRSNEYTHPVMHEVCPASRLWPHTTVVARCCGASSGRGRAEAAWASCSRSRTSRTSSSACRLTAPNSLARRAVRGQLPALLRTRPRGHHRRRWASSSAEAAKQVTTPTTISAETRAGSEVLR